ncbi:RCC1 domain-containing protein [Trueperella sp. LYQ143]|uniref:RCC1 domain-containing protein n=1 Tax=Trueperella sp. LYQ143 TaxID=3391059 RepID=UPI003983C831
MVIDPSLEPENLRVIAQDNELSADLLAALKDHPSCWPGLRAWVEYVQVTGEHPPLPPIVYIQPADEPTAGSTISRGFPLKRLAVIAIAAALVVVLILLWQVVGQRNSSPQAIAEHEPSPTTPPVSTDTVFASGKGFMCLAKDASITCLGANNLGQLGTGKAGTENIHHFELSAPVEHLVAGSDFACASTASSITCWGDNRWRQAGDKSDQILSPTVIELFAGKPVDDLVAGAIHACALSEGKVWCWGSDYYGQLGSGTQGSLASGPTALSLDSASFLLSSDYSTCAGVKDALVCWGSNESHRLSAQDVPILVPTVIKDE